MKLEKFNNKEIPELIFQIEDEDKKINNEYWSLLNMSILEEEYRKR